MAERKLTVTILGDSRSLTKAFANANKASKGFGSSMAKVGKIAAVGVGAAFAVMALALKRGFGEFMESQAVIAQTAAVLKSTGGAANVTARHVDALAGALSRMSGIDDEAIAAGSNMLLTFTNIRNAVGKGPKIFDEATKTILDMSVAMGKDLPSTAIMVGKALNDTTVNSKGTITGWSALRRVGVLVSAEMMDMARSFIEAGKPMEAQKLLLKELQTEFGGSARAFGGTLPGAFSKLRNAVDEVAGAFAQGLAPIVQHVATLLANKMANPAFVARVRELGRLVGQKLHDAFVAISTWFQAHWPQIKDGFRTAAQLAQRMATAVRHIFNRLQQVSTVTPGGAGTLIGLIMGGVLLKKIGLLGKALGAAGLLGAGGLGGKGKGGGLGIKGGVVGFGLSGAGREVPSGVGGVTRIGDFEGLMRLARQGKLSAHALEVASKALTRAQMRQLRNANRGGGRAGPGRAIGGPVRPGVAYTVGERGPETFVSSRGGMILPNGAGGIVINGDINLPGVQNAKQFLEELQRISKNSASQTRGRYGGQKLGLG